MQIYKIWWIPRVQFTEISLPRGGIMAWISNYANIKIWKMITHPCPNLTGVDKNAAEVIDD